MLAITFDGLDGYPDVHQFLARIIQHTSKHLTKCTCRNIVWSMCETIGTIKSDILPVIKCLARHIMEMQSYSIDSYRVSAALQFYLLSFTFSNALVELEM